MLAESLLALWGHLSVPVLGLAGSVGFWSVDSSLSIHFGPVAIGLMGYLVGTYLGLIASAVLFTPAAL